MGKTNSKVDYQNDKIAALAGKCEHKTLATWAANCAESRQGQASQIHNTRANFNIYNF